MRWTFDILNDKMEVQASYSLDDTPLPRIGEKIEIDEVEKEVKDIVYDFINEIVNVLI